MGGNVFGYVGVDGTSTDTNGIVYSLAELIDDGSLASMASTGPNSFTAGAADLIAGETGDGGDVVAIGDGALWYWWTQNGDSTNASRKGSNAVTFIKPTADAPSINPPSGQVTGDDPITITASGADEIYFTTALNSGAATPDNTSILYTSSTSANLEGASVGDFLDINTIAYKAGYFESGVTNANLEVVPV